MFGQSLMHRFDGNATVLPEHTIRKHAPSAFAEQAAADRSERYAFIRTIDIIREMEQHGFQVVRAAEARTRIEERRGFTKHLIVFRHRDHMGYAPMRVLRRMPEIVLNLVQENILRGGLKGSSPTSGRQARTRAVNSVSENVRTNKALWRLAGEMARLMGLAAPAQPQGQIIDVEAEVIA